MDDIGTLRDAALADIAACADLQALEALRVELLGRKGSVTQLAKGLGSLDPDARREAGQVINAAKTAISEALESRQADLGRVALDARMAAERVDVTLPGRGTAPGGLHPVTRTLRRIERIFAHAGFDVAEGPEVEDEYHNFEALNIGKSPSGVVRGKTRLAPPYPPVRS